MQHTGRNAGTGYCIGKPYGNVVWLALESLEPKYRILLYLYYYEGYSIRELIGILKRKESTLQTQLAAGRRKLKEELKKQGRFRKIGKGRENK